MFGIINIAGQQFKVKQDDKIYVHRLQGNVGDAVEAQVLMTSSDGNINLKGNASVEILGHLQGDKVITFHKKRRKGYTKKIGHREALTQVKVTSIG